MAGKICTIVGVAVIIIGLNIMFWKLDRWINWKLSYGPQVEQRLIDVESRLTKLEAKHEDRSR